MLLCLRDLAAFDLLVRHGQHVGRLITVEMGKVVEDRNMPLIAVELHDRDRCVADMCELEIGQHVVDH